MNTKRQTIWLVSMLSLMVVLSAYYLFTEDVSKLDVASQSTPVQDVKVDSKESGQPAGGKSAPAAAIDKTAGTAADSAARKAADSAGSQAADSAAKSGSGTKATAAKSAADTKATGANSGAAKETAADAKKSASNSAADAAVLQKVASGAHSGDEFFASEQLKRSDNLSKQTEQLLTIITNSKTSTEAMSKAYEDLQKIEQKEAKQANIEGKLAKDYGQAVVLEEGNKWKVVVKAADMEKSQALSILDMVMQEMNIGPEKVSVQHIK